MLSGQSGKFLMRVLFCKIHYPSFICFCKPSPHIYTSGPLKLENTTHVPPKLVTLPETSDNQLPGERGLIKEEEERERGLIKEEEEILGGKHEHLAENPLKSNLRKPNSDSADSTEKQKKRVRWMDLLGKELVEIREFESSEIEDTDYETEDNRSCICVIS